jgi:hypothetical protein
MEGKGSGRTKWQCINRICVGMYIRPGRMNGWMVRLLDGWIDAQEDTLRSFLGRAGIEME